MTDKQAPEWMGKNAKLTPAEIKEFLAEPWSRGSAPSTRMACRTSLRSGRNGRAAFWIVLCERSAWVAHIKKNPNCAISCAQDSGTYKRITAQGKAEIVFGPAPMQGRCLESPGPWRCVSSASTGRNICPTCDRPRYLIKIIPTKMLTWDGIQWAKKYTENNRPLAGSPPALMSLAYSSILLGVM